MAPDPSVHRYCCACGEKLFPEGPYKLLFYCREHGWLRYEQTDDPWGQAPRDAEQALELIAAEARAAGRAFEFPFTSIEAYYKEQEWQAALEEARSTELGRITDQVISEVGFLSALTPWTDEQRARARALIESFGLTEQMRAHAFFYFSISAP